MDPLAYFSKLYEPAKRQRDAMASDWDTYEAAYLGEPEHDKPKGKGAWRSFIHFKYAWQQVHTLVAAIAAEDDPTFAWEARDAARSKYADTVQGVVGLQLDRDDYAEKRYMSVLTAAVYGGCPVKFQWLFSESGDVVIDDRPTANPLDPRSFFYDPRARHMREARYAGHEMFMEVAELRARTKADGSPLYTNLDELGSGSQSGSSDSFTNTLDNDKSGERDKARRQGVHVIEMWTRDRIMVRANGVLIRNDPNPHPYGRLPFEVVRLMPTLNDVWGVSLIWALRDPQALIQSLDNAAMDNIKLALDPPRAVDTTDDATNVQREWMPGQVYPSRSPSDAVKPLNAIAIDPNSAQASLQAIRNITKEITGITDEVAGASQADTATQAALNDRAAKGRLGVMLRQVDSAWARVAQGFLQLNQKYLDLSVPVKVMGQGHADWRHMSPAEIAGQWDVRPKNSSERIVKELHRENLMNAIGALGPFAERSTPSGMTIDPTALIAELVETFGIPKDRVIVPAEMMRQQREADALSAARGQAAAMAMMPQQPMAPPAPAPVPEEQPSLIEQAQSKLFSSINYKDLPDAAQKAMLEDIGLPSDGVESDNQNPTRPNAGKLKLEGRSTGQKAAASASKEAAK
jgi:hypothetical protein